MIQDEAKALTGEEDFEKGAEKLLSYGCQYVIITLSQNGCSVYFYQTVDETNKILNHTHQTAFHVDV